MIPEDAKQKLSELLETLAAIEHDRWAHWQRYMHGKGERLPDGSLLLPADLVRRWELQIATPYSELTECEKDSDRDQVKKYLPVVLEAFGPPTAVSTS